MFVSPRGSCCAELPLNQSRFLVGIIINGIHAFSQKSFKLFASGLESQCNITIKAIWFILQGNEPSESKEESWSGAMRRTHLGWHQGVQLKIVIKCWATYVVNPEGATENSYKMLSLFCLCLHSPLCTISQWIAWECKHVKSETQTFTLAVFGQGYVSPPPHSALQKIGPR